MKTKLAFLTMLIVAFFAGFVGLTGCGDKYANLNIKFVGNEIQTNEETGVSYIEVEYDEKDSSKNDLSFSALLNGYDDSMRTGLTLVVPQEKILINSSEIKGAKTTFNVTLLTSGIIPVTIYSIETSKVFVKFEIRALLKTKELAAKQKNLNMVRPSDDSEIEYKLVEKSGSEHKPVFKVELIIDRKVISVENGNSLKLAEQKCAKTAVEKMF